MKRKIIAYMATAFSLTALLSGCGNSNVDTTTSATAELLPLAEECGICLLTENFNKMCVPDMYWVDSAQDERELIDYVDHPLLQGCWDTGHGNMQATSQREAVNLLGSRLRALHVQDNLGNEDHHFAPFFGTMDIDSLPAAAGRTPPTAGCASCRLR